MDSGGSGQPGQPVTDPVEVESCLGRDSVTLQLLSMVGIHVLEKLIGLKPVKLLQFYVKVSMVLIIPSSQNQCFAYLWIKNYKYQIQLMIESIFWKLFKDHQKLNF